MFFKNRWKVFQKPSTPIFFICLYFIGVGGDENLKKIFGDFYVHNSDVIGLVCALTRL